MKWHAGVETGNAGNAGNAGGDVKPGGNNRPDGKKGKKTTSYLSALLCLLCLVFIAGSAAMGFETGIRLGENLWTFFFSMIKILPGAFILIGLFEVWVPREIVERHLGETSGIKGHIWGILLASTIVGGLYVAFPVAHVLQKKGAGLPVIFTFLGASGICRIPMTLFEISFMGLEFTLLRYAVSIPLLIISSHILGSILQRKGFRLTAP